MVFACRISIKPSGAQCNHRMADFFFPSSRTASSGLPELVLGTCCLEMKNFPIRVESLLLHFFPQRAGGGGEVRGLSCSAATTGGPVC